MTGSFVALLALLAPAAHAQDAVADTDQPGVEKVEGRIPEEVKAFKEAQGRFAERMKELEDDTRSFVDLREREEKEKLTAGYDSILSDLTTSERDHRTMSIERMEGFLAEYPDTRYAAHVRFRLADLYFEDSSEEWLAASKEYFKLEEELGDARLDELPPPPKKDFSRSLALYQRIIDDNRDLPRDQQYEHLDGAFYMLGFLLADSAAMQKDDTKSRQAFEDLVAVRPDSDLVDSAHLFIGNYWFDYNDFGKAISEYQKVFDYGPEGEHYDAAMYQLAWSYYKLAGPEKSAHSMGPEGYEKALDLFTQVLELSDERFKTQGMESDFKPDAVKYLAISFSDIADFSGKTPVQVAEEWFAHRTGDWEWDIYVQLGEVLTQQARFEQAIEVYEKLQTDPRWVDKPENPNFQFKIVKLYVSGGTPDIAASAAARVTLTERYNDDTGWWTANRTHPEALATARKYIEESLADVAVEYRLKADASGKPADYMLAASKFREYLQKFPISDDYYEQQWYLADTLVKGQAYGEAADEYALLVKSGRYHDYYDGAAWYLMNTRLKLLQESYAPPAVAESWYDPSALERGKTQAAFLWMIPKAGSVERTYTTPAGITVDVYALTPDHKAFIEAVDALLSHKFTTPKGDLPDFGKELSAQKYKIEYIVAQMLVAHQRYDEARPRLAAIIEEYPKKNEAAYAAGLMVATYQQEGDLDQVRLLTRKYMTMALGEDTTLIGQKQTEFASLLEGTAFKQALAYSEAGEREKAAEAFLAFAEEFPKSQYVDEAIYDAANSYEILGQAKKANDLFEEYVRRWPDDERSKKLYFRIAANYESTFDLDKAIKFYEQLYTRFPDYKDSPDAMYMAAFLKIGLGDHQGAAQGFERYAEKYPAKDDREQVYYRAGEQWEQVGRREAKRFYEKYLREYGLKNPEHAFEAKYKLAQMYLAEKNNAEYRRYMDEILKDFDKLAKEGTALGWAARHYAAESRFRELQTKFDDLQKLKLTGSEKGDLTLLDETLPAKVAEIETLGIEIVTTYQDFEYSSAALYTVASAYMFSADLGLSLQPPPSLPPELEDAWWRVVESEVFPQFYTAQDKAVARFSKVIETATDQKQHTVWVDKAYAQLNTLDPRKYPKPKAEILGGVESSSFPEMVPMRAEAPAVEPAPAPAVPTPEMEGAP